MLGQFEVQQISQLLQLPCEAEADEGCSPDRSPAVPSRPSSRGQGRQLLAAAQEFSQVCSLRLTFAWYPNEGRLQALIKQSP